MIDNQVVRELIRGYPPELRRSMGQLLGVSSFTRLGLREEPLQRRSVLRLTWTLDGVDRRMVVKRLASDRALIEELVLRRWLPAAGLTRLAPALLGVAPERDGSHVWHVYADLGNACLDTEQDACSKRPDRGFLSPITRSPERHRVERVIESIAVVHERFEGHALLGECRRLSNDLGAAYFTSSVRDAIAALETLRLGAPPLADEQDELCERLLCALYRAREESSWRCRCIEQYDHRETLLHGDLGVRNVFTCQTPEGTRGVLIDWDHAGVGPVSYDLSTFLMQFPPQDRHWILNHYQALRDREGHGWPSVEQWNLLFETAELARLANCAIWPAKAAQTGDAAWAFDDLAKVDAWIGALSPVLSPDCGQMVSGI